MIVSAIKRTFLNKNDVFFFKTLIFIEEVKSNRKILDNSDTNILELSKSFSTDFIHHK